MLEKKFDPGFGKDISWDIPLLGGYEHEFVENTSKQPGSHHYTGIVNPGLLQKIDAWDPDAVLVFGWAFVSHLKCIRYFSKKKPVYFRGDSTVLGRRKGIKAELRKIFLKWVYSHIDTAFYAGSNNRDYFKEFGLKEEQLVFAPHAIDNDRFSDIDGTYARKALEWKTKLGIEKNDVVIVYAGKLEAVKNLHFIIEAGKKIEGLPIKFVFVGNGPLENELKTLAGKDDRFIFIGFQNQATMPIVYRLGSVFILSSFSETWGLGVNEAMACGCAILVSTGCGCATDLVKPGQNGFIFDLDDNNGLVSNLKYLAGHIDELAAMGVHSSQLIKSWSFANICKAIEQKMKKDPYN